MLRNARSLILGDGMKARVIRGGGLSFFSLAVHNVMRLGSNLILTRLLFPEAFGLMAIVVVVMSGAAMFSDLGIRGSVIQDDRGEDPDFLATAWTVQVIRGVVIWLAVALLARPISVFYDAPELAVLLPVAGLEALISGASSINAHVASRNIRLGRQVMLNIGTYAVSLLVTFALAYAWQSVWALVVGMLVRPVFWMILSHAIFPGPPPRLALDRDALSRLFGFGRYIFIATLATFFVNQGDRAILAKFVSLGEIAIYNIAYFLAAVPLLIGNSLVGVLHPLYARRPPWESDENRDKIARARYGLTAGLLAVVAIMALISVPLVELLYDPRYEAAAPVMTLITLSLIPQIITMSYLKLPLAAGHSGRYAIMLLSIALVQLAFLLWGASQAGLVGVALAPALTWIVAYPVLAWGIRPYRSHDPLHDALFAGIGVAITALALWLHRDAVMPLFDVF